MPVSRVTIPENFYDITSARLLSQPEPQYPLAMLFLAAVGASLPIPAGLGLNGREVPSAGAPYASADADRLKLAEALPTNLFALTIDFNKTPGNTVRINRPLFPNTVYTTSSRRVSSTDTISTKPVGISSEQTHLTLERYAGPVDPTTQRPAPIGIDAFDSNMGVHSMPSAAGTHLVRDFHRFIDSAHVTMANAGDAIRPDGMKADNDATTAGSFPMTLEQVSRAEESMDDDNLPTLPDASRLLVLSPTQWKQLKHDPEFKSQAEYHKEYNLLFPNYVGSVGKFHIFKSTTLSRTKNSSNVYVHGGIAIAPGGFMGGVGRKPRVGTSTDDNFGETGKVIWLADLAFGIADNRFFRSVRSA